MPMVPRPYIGCRDMLFLGGVGCLRVQEGFGCLKNLERGLLGVLLCSH